MHCLPFSLILTLFLSSSALALAPTKRSYNTHDYYVLEHDPNGPASLADVARILGVDVIEQAGELLDHWLVRVQKPSFELRSAGEARDRVLETLHNLRSLAEESPSLSGRSESHDEARRFTTSVKFLSRQTPRQRIKRAPIPSSERQEADSSSRAVAERLGIQDPLFPKQWHLVNDEFPEHMMNVTAVWEMGLTGKGIISSLVDDGLDYTSEDLKDNFDADDSYDFNDHEDLPFPKLADDHHGTRCAGQIAAGKNNACGLGIAYESKVAGVRILSGAISDVDEAAALNYGYQNVSIYSCSWGPPDDGKSMEGPSQLISKAVLNGINKGRGGKGSIFVFASGNGAAKGDQCNFDGYTNSIYSVTVSAIDYKGLHPYYSEPCAANMIVAYSSGSGNHIVTTDKGENECASSHGGTSAAAPNAVGVFALALEARPDLTWRDIQHLCVRTARIVNPDDPDWELIAQGQLYSYKYGFGVLDAWRFITAAKDWKLVKPQAWFKTHTIQLGNGVLNKDREYSGGQFIVQKPADGADMGVKSVITVTQDMLDSHNFESLEHVNIRVWIDHARRGDVEVELVSPKGIKSILGGHRIKDLADTGYPGWTFMSVKHWGEDPVGDWTIRVADQGNPEFNGTFLGWNMVFWGSTSDPAKATLYELPDESHAFPPPDPKADDSVLPVASTTRLPTRPTANLPPDHGDAEGENSNVAFPSASARPTSTPTPDEGYFSDLSKLVSSQRWFFGAVAVVAVFAIGAGAFFWYRRRAMLQRMAYSTLPAEDVHMGVMESAAGGLLSGRGPRAPPGGARGRGTGTRELYDAFGEVSDDEDADEATRLNPNSQGPADESNRRMELAGNELGFHSGFLDDDDPPSGAGSAMNIGGRSEAHRYRDEPDS